jgi:DNA-binding GntR family transcriptional regulator
VANVTQLSSPPRAATGADRTLSAARQVEMVLREQIISLEIAPGSRLSEVDLAIQNHVSRQPVREALIALSKIGLVQVLPQRGTLVTRISTRHMMQVRIAREALETAIVRRACERFDPVIRASIDAILETQARAAAEGDSRTITSSDSQFHAAIAAGADCEMIWQMVQDVKVHMDRVRHLTLQDRASMRILVEQHRAIITAIDTGEPEQAEAAMKHHLYEIMHDLPRVLAQNADLFD